MLYNPTELVEIHTIDSDRFFVTSDTPISEIIKLNKKLPKKTEVIFFYGKCEHKCFLLPEVDSTLTVPDFLKSSGINTTSQEVEYGVSFFKSHKK